MQFLPRQCHMVGASSAIRGGLMVSRKTWVLVTIGVRVRILGGFGEHGSKTGFEFYSKAKSTHLRHVLADRTGQSLASPGRERLAEAASDPILRDMHHFARDTLDLLGRHLRAGAFQYLAIFASPRMLGLLCKLVPSSLHERTIFTQPGNLVRLPDDELRRVIPKALRTESAI